MATEPVLAAEDVARIERLAARVVELRLETPAILALESARPLRLVASQSLVFFEPLVQSLFPMTEWRRWSELAARPEALEALVRAIEERAEASRAGNAKGTP